MHAPCHWVRNLARTAGVVLLSQLPPSTDAIFYSLTTSPCYSCSDNNPKVQTINGFTAYSPLKCLATGSALGTVGEYTVIQTKGAAMGSRIDLGTAWMT
jgi:hypothetical protein